MELELTKVNLDNNVLKSQINGEQELREDRVHEEEIAFNLVQNDFKAQI